MGFKLKLPNPTLWVSAVRNVITDLVKAIQFFIRGSYAPLGYSSPLLWDPSRIEQAFFASAFITAISEVIQILYNLQGYVFLGLLTGKILSTAITFVILYGIGCCIQFYRKWSMPAWVYYGIAAIGVLNLAICVFQVLGSFSQLGNGIVYFAIALLTALSYCLVGCLFLDTFLDVVRGKLPLYDVENNKYVGRPFVDPDPFMQAAAQRRDQYVRPPQQKPEQPSYNPQDFANPFGNSGSSGQNTQSPSDDDVL